MRFTKRVLSALLALVMVFTMLPLQVWAEEVGSQDSDNSVNLVGMYGGAKAADPVAARVELNESSALISIGNTCTFSPKVYDEEGNPMEVTGYIWTSDNPEIASVENGTVTGVNAGVAKITCQYGELTAMAMVTVTQATYQLTYSIEYPSDAKKFAYNSGVGDDQESAVIVTPSNTTITESYDPGTEVTIPDGLATTINYRLIGFADTQGNMHEIGSNVTISSNMKLTSIWEKVVDESSKDKMSMITLRYHSTNSHIDKSVSVMASEPKTDGNRQTRTITFMTANIQDTLGQIDSVKHRNLKGWRINDKEFAFNSQATVTIERSESWWVWESWPSRLDVYPVEGDYSQGQSVAQFYVRKQTVTGTSETEKTNYYSVGTGTVENLPDGTTSITGEAVQDYIVSAPSLTQIASLMNESLPAGATVNWYKMVDTDNGYHVDGEIRISGRYWNVKFIDPDSGKAVEQQLVQDGDILESVMDGSDLNTQLREFKHWSLQKDGEPVNLTEHTVHKDITFYAVFKRYSGYTVKHLFEDLDGNYVEDKERRETIRAEVGEQTNATAKSVEGFTALAFEQKKVTEDGRTTIEIKYSRNSYDVRYTITGDAQGVTAPEEKTYKFGATVEQEAKLQKEGYSFDGWNTDDVTIEDNKFKMPAKDVTFTGEFIQPYTVTVKLYAGSRGSATEAKLLDTRVAEVDWEDLLELKTMSKEALATRFWGEEVGSSEMYGAESWSPKDLNKTIHNYTVEIYLKENSPALVTLTYDANGEDVTNMPDPLSEKYLKGREVTVASAPERENYTFEGWKDSSGTLHPANSEIILTEDTTLYAVWEPTAKQGTSITVRVVKDGVQVNASDYVSVEKAIGTPSLTVTESQTHTLDYTYENLDCADFDLSVTVPVGYSVDVTSNKPGPTGTADLDISGEGERWRLDNVPGGATVTVSLTTKQFKVTYNTDGNGKVLDLTNNQVAVFEETVDYNQNATGTTAVPNKGYYFVEWRDADGQQVGTNAAFTPEGVITADATYTAVFAKKTEITVKANDLSKEYDGTAIMAENATFTANGLPVGYTLDVTYATEKAPTNVEDDPGTLKIASVTVKNEEGQDVTDQFQITKETGTLTIKPKPVTVTIKGNQETKTYNGSEQSVGGYKVEIPEDSGYTEGSITFVGEAIAKGTNAGTYYMSLTEDDFGNTDTNYDVTFEVHDGHLTIGPVTDKVVVTIVGHYNTATYDGEPHTASGYDVKSIMLGGEPTNLYKETDVGLANGATAKITQTNANIGEEKYLMGLTASSFKNNSKNFTNVEFVVTDGWLRISPATMTLSAVGYDEKYDGDYHDGTVTAPEGATLRYSTDGGTNWSATAPTVKNVADGTINVKVKATLANYQDAVETYTLNVQPRNVTLTSGDSSVPYGNTAESRVVTPGGDGFVAGEGVTYSNFASLTLVGSKPNTFDYTRNEGTDERNYNITKNYGTLTVTEAGVEDKDVVTKTHDPKEGDYKLGDTVTFTIKVTNIYNEDKTLSVVEQAGVEIVGDVPSTIEAGKTIELTATYRITENDIKNGSFVNTVTVTLGDIPFEGEDTVKLEEAEGALTVEKTIVEPKKEAYGLNDTIHYQIKVTNSGNVTLENITLSDVLKVGEGDGRTLTATQPDDFTGTLAPGASVTYTASYTVLEADLGKTIVNTATATGSYTDKDGQPQEVKGSSFVSANTVDKVRLLNVEKKITNEKTFAMGETIDYEIVVTNSGNQTLNNIVVTDPLTGMKETIVTLAPNETAYFETSYQVTMGDVLAGKVVNTATATAGDVKDSGDATATITGLDSLRAEVVLNSKSYTYDGEEHTVAGGELTVKLGGAEQNGFSVKFAKGTATATDKDVLYNEKGEVIGYLVTATAGDVTIWYGGKNVTDKFVGRINIAEGALIINPKPVTLSTKNASKDYDGTALTMDGVAGTDGFVGGDVTEVKATGTQTLVGESQNTIKIFWSSDALAKNYDITENLGTLTVTAPDDFDYVQKKFNGQKFAIGDNVTFTITVTNIYDVPATVVLKEQPGMTFADGKTELTVEIPAGATREFTVSHEVTEAEVEAGQITNEVTWTLKPNDLPEISGTDEEIIQNPKYTVSYRVSGETPVGYTSPEDADYPIGKSVSVAEMPSYPGYTFTGWTAPEDITVNEGKFAMPEKNVTLSGVFALAGDTKYKVEHYFAKLDGQYPDNPNHEEIKTGTTFADTDAQPIPEGQRPGFGVVSWANEKIQPDGNTVIKIYYNRKEYKISWETSGEPADQEQTFETRSFLYGADISEVKNPEVKQFDGYTWSDWSKTTLPGTMPAEDIVITGSYTPIDYTVTYQLAKDSEIPTDYTAPVDTKYHIGDIVTVEDDAQVPGYNFEGWYTEDGEVTADMSTFAMPAGDVTLYGKFSKRTDLAYTVKYYWIGDSTKTIKEDLVVSGQTFDTEVTLDDEQKPDIDGFTLIPAEYKAEIGVGENVVKVYYYKNVTLTAKNKVLTYNGETQTAKPGYVSSEENAVFEGIVPTGSGKDAKEYHIAFPENTLNTVDETELYIVADVKDGTLTINKRQVALESESGEQVYNGTALTNNNVSIDGDGFVEGDVTEVKATGTQTLVGESDNTIEITWEDETVAGNYEISTKVGKLTVTAPDNLNGYVAKTHAEQNFKVGDTVTFKISVTNIYAVKATVTLKEEAGMTFENGQTTLEDVLDPGETKTYTATHTLTDADFKNDGVSNTVKVTLDPEGEEPEIPGEKTDEVELEEKPDMSVVKTVLNPKESYRVGDTIQYQITVTNTGNVTLHDLELTDEMNADGKVTFPAGTNRTRETLNVGDSWTVTCSYVVRAADEGKTISNTAKVISRDDDGNPNKDGEDTTPGESVQKRYSLTIHYRNGAGNAVAGSYSARYHVGDSFKIDSPIVAGYYDPQIRSISSGANGMPAQDLEYVVIYTAIPVPAPDPGPGPAPNPGPGPGPAPNPGPDDGDDDDDTPPVPNPEQEQPPQPQDFEIDPDDYTLTELEDNETPLANLDLDGHTCCILHLLLMLAAMVVLGFYTKSRKKHQARIFELKRILAAEEDHPDDPQQP